MAIQSTTAHNPFPPRVPRAPWPGRGVCGKAEKGGRPGYGRQVVRYSGMIHGFAMVNSMHDRNAARMAVRQAVTFIKDVIGGDGEKQ